jgi:hypothetical protein
MPGTPALQPAEFLRRLFDDVEFSYLVVVAAQLGVADLLASGPGPIADLAAATGADARRCIASCGLSQAGACLGRTVTSVLSNAVGRGAAHRRRSQHSSSGIVEWQ